MHPSESLKAVLLSYPQQVLLEDLIRHPLVTLGVDRYWETLDTMERIDPEYL